MRTHLNLNCEFRTDKIAEPLFSPVGVFSALRYLYDTHPDVIVCVLNTKIQGNKIYSSSYVKGTDSPANNRALLRTGLIRPFHNELSQARENRIMSRMDLRTKTLEETDVLEADIAKDVDLQILIKSDMVLTVDPETGKICDFELSNCFLTVEVVDNKILS